MRDVMLEVMLLESQAGRVNIERLASSERTSRIASLRWRSLMKFRIFAGLARAYWTFLADWHRCPDRPRRDQHR